MEKIPKELEAILEPGEKVKAAAKTYAFKHPKFVVVTDRRVLIWRKGFVGGSEENIPFERISHVGLKRGMMSDELTINMGGHVLKIEGLDHSRENNPKLVFDAINERLQAQAGKGYCPFCGALLVPGAAFCPSCGKKVKK